MLFGPTLDRYASAHYFYPLAGRLLPWLGALTALAFAIGLPWSLWLAPVDYQQGDSVRIMYVHVPSAWLSMLAYVVMAVASGVYLVWRIKLADALAEACVPVGASFTALALITGSIWGRPMWGTWWEWGDARLMSELVLLFLYLGVLALRSAIDEPARAGRAAAVLTVVGVVNIPIIHYSVELWNTLHQPASVVRAGGPSIHPDLLWPLLVMALAFTLFFAVVVLLRMRGTILERERRARWLLAAEAQA